MTEKRSEKWDMYNICRKKKIELFVSSISVYIYFRIFPHEMI